MMMEREIILQDGSYFMFQVYAQYLFQCVCTMNIQCRSVLDSCNTMRRMKEFCNREVGLQSLCIDFKLMTCWPTVSVIAMRLTFKEVIWCVIVPGFNYRVCTKSFYR
jgi:hypothetical protein